VATLPASAGRTDGAPLQAMVRSREHHRTGDALALGAFTALLGLFWWLRFYAPGRDYTFASSDLFVYYAPMQQLVADALRAGRLPLWNPAQLCGIPLLATQQVGALYPPHFLYLAIPPPLGLEVQSLLHLLLAGVATYALARALALSRFAALVGAVVFALNGYLIWYSFLPNYQEAAPWLPVGLLALVRLRHRRSIGWLCCWAAAEAAPILAGYMQLWVLFNYAWAATAVTIALHAARRDGIAAAAQYAAVVAGGAVIGVAASGIQLLPAIELARQSIRPTSALSWQEVNPYGSYPEDMLRRAFFGYERMTPDYLGLVALLLIPAAIAVRGRRGLALGVLAGGALPYLITLGPVTPFYRLYLLAPGMAIFRFPLRIQVLCVLAVALLAALAVDGVAAATRLPRRARVPLVVLALTAALAAWMMIRHHAAPTLPLLTLGIALAGLAFGAGARTMVAVALLGLIAADQFAAVRNTFLTPYHPAGRAMVGRYVRHLRQLLATDPMARFVILGASIVSPDFHPKVATRIGGNALDDYEPMVTTRQVDVLAPPQAGKPRPKIVRRSTGSAENVPRPFLDLAGTRFVVLAAAKTPPATVDDSVRGMKLRGMMVAGTDHDVPSNGAPIYENPDALPRAFAVYDWRVMENPDGALAAVASAAVPVATTAVLEEHPPADLGPPSPDVPAATVAIRHYAPESVELETTVERPALLVLTDTFYPGWEATVDGRPTPVLRADYLFRAVPVAAGHHTVRFTYRPASVRVGAACTGVALLTLAAVGVASWRRRRRQST
jgi:hypothetical protein